MRTVEAEKITALVEKLCIEACCVITDDIYSCFKNCIKTEKSALGKEILGTLIEGLLDEYLADKELEIYNIEYKKKGKDWKLRIYLDKPIGCDSEYVDINECEDVTHFLSDAVDRKSVV